MADEIRLKHASIRSTRIQFPPNSLTVAFDHEGISDPVDEATAQEAETVGFDRHTPPVEVTGNEKVKK